MPAPHHGLSLFEGDRAGDHAAGDLGIEVIQLDAFERPGSADLLPGLGRMGENRSRSAWQPSSAMLPRPTTC